MKRRDENMDILLTGFGPFRDEKINSSIESVTLLEGLNINGAKIHTRGLPLARYRSIEALKSAVAELDPQIIICVGQGVLPEIRLEHTAVNTDNFQIPDADGNLPKNEHIIADGPSAYFATLPVKKIANALSAAKIPVSISDSAGTFICNHVFYGLMNTLAIEGNKRRGGFIHVPRLCKKNNESSAATGSTGATHDFLPIHTIAMGLKIAIETVLADFCTKK